MLTVLLSAITIPYGVFGIEEDDGWVEGDYEGSPKEQEERAQEDWEDAGRPGRAELVKRVSGRYVTTALGNVVYEAVSLVGKALNYYWILKAVESFQAPTTINSKEAISKLIDSLVDEQAIKKILTDPPIAS